MTDNNDNVDNKVPAEVMNREITDLEDSVNENVDTVFPFNSEGEMRTVFNDPVNFNVKHPLFNAWTLWFDNPGKKASVTSWSLNLKELITFDSVEEFWGVYNNVVKASDLSSGSNYHLFKRGIKPMWEDPVNEYGGKWVVQFMRNKTGEDINTLWLYTMLACIGEEFDYADEVCGAVVSVRKIFYRISLWTRSSDNKEICMTLGHFEGLENDFSPRSFLPSLSHNAKDDFSFNKTEGGLNPQQSVKGDYETSSGKLHLNLGEKPGTTRLNVKNNSVPNVSP
ncbi:13004_t:CDS:2 [Funneliformis mosseae]|uniref:13004_t:CDS:1 n=1 Tax=Funneliformis mosseae TaxID=27381 RepID=A0A9N9E2D0_FUNMO|nr:13004_t:CDS:2 [Funneliformis mosseae]